MVRAAHASVIAHWHRDVGVWALAEEIQMKCNRQDEGVVGDEGLGGAKGLPGLPPGLSDDSGRTHKRNRNWLNSRIWRVLGQVMEPNKVVQELKVLQEEGREDLLKEGVLEQACVGLRRRKRASSEGVTVAILACKSPEQDPKKCKSKSASGQKVKLSTEGVVEVTGEGAANVHLLQSVRGGGARRSGASFRQRVASGGRGVVSRSAVAVVSRVGLRLGGAHALKSKRASGRGRRQAPSTLKKMTQSGWSWN
ncbi:hypothetical protein NDU88_003598 [Pleurodeles waltl]|uniref:Uncharacterized protein n=1 Tax=Pleurodeles waltl TaxID=8319 RepID=A0AAV7LFS6_PLEWA|nr:hypothetical protein NDU88_003598 [Pleurodeles waltl]